MISCNTISGDLRSPHLIIQEAKKGNPQLFLRLTEQVVGRWIDRDARDAGLNKWKDSVLARVKQGNAPSDENTATCEVMSILQPHPQEPMPVFCDTVELLLTHTSANP